MRRSSLLLACLAPAVLGGVGLVALGTLGERAPAGRAAEPSAPAAERAAEPAVAGGAEGFLRSRSEVAPVDAVEPAREPVRATPEAAARATEKLWISGLVELPAGTPEGERLEVVAEARGLGPEDDGRALAEPDGSFVVAVPADAGGARLRIEADHLRLDEPLDLDPRDPPVPLVLRPRLAALVVGRVRGAGSLAGRIAGTRVRLRSEAEVRFGAMGEGARFAFRGVAPASGARLDGDPERFAPWTTTVDLVAGETTAVEIELERGRSVAARVLDAEGAPIRHARLKVVVVDAAKGRTAPSRRRARSTGRTRTTARGRTRSTPWSARGASSA